jgi:hypothetical protein
LPRILSFEPVKKLAPYESIEEIGCDPLRLKFGTVVPERSSRVLRAAEFGPTLLHCSPEEEITVTFGYFREAVLALELETNYERWVPKKKMNEIIRVIAEDCCPFDDAKPLTIVLKKLDEYFILSSPYSASELCDEKLNYSLALAPFCPGANANVWLE